MSIVRFELHLESFTTALADHQLLLYMAVVRVLHSPLDPNALAENASSLTGRQTDRRKLRRRTWLAIKVDRSRKYLAFSLGSSRAKAKQNLVTLGKFSPNYFISWKRQYKLIDYFLFGWTHQTCWQFINENCISRQTKWDKTSHISLFQEAHVLSCKRWKKMLQRTPSSDTRD